MSTLQNLPVVVGERLNLRRLVRQGDERRADEHVGQPVQLAAQP